MISHDWHVQPSCQRPNRDPPRRREFSPGENARKHFRLSSKLYNHTVRLISRQSLLPTEFPDDFHIGNVVGGRAAINFGGRSELRATVWSSAGNWTPLSARAFCDRHFAQPRRKTEIEKRSLLPGGPCFEGTLRNCLLSE